VEAKGYVPEGVPKEVVEEIMAARNVEGGDGFSFVDYTVAEFECVRKMFFKEF